tara:strand:- start:522 stop:914 length:393 start_codon:yes stop_codon:yes gene_type:complete
MKEIISKKQLREFGIFIGFGFPIFLGWLLPAIAGHGFRLWTLWVSILGFLIGLISPNLLRLPYKIWMKLGHSIGWVNSRIILSLIFVLVLLPISLIMRLTGYDPLNIRRRGVTSYRKNPHPHQVDLTRIF